MSSQPGIEAFNSDEVLELLNTRKPRKKWKYGVDTSKEAKARRGGFDSDTEAAYYDYLDGLLAAGQIRRLMVHPTFEILTKFETVGGKHSACHLTPDFTFEIERNGCWVPVAADVKGQKADSYFNLRRKLFQQARPAYEFWIVTRKRKGAAWEVEVK